MAKAPPTDTSDDFVTAAQACELLGVKLNTLYAYASRKRLRSYQLGRRRQRFYLRSEVEELAGSVPAASEALRTSIPKAEEWVRYK